MKMNINNELKIRIETRTNLNMMRKGEIKHNPKAESKLKPNPKKKDKSKFNPKKKCEKVKVVNV